MKRLQEKKKKMNKTLQNAEISGSKPKHEDYPRANRADLSFQAEIRVTRLVTHLLFCSVNKCRRPVLRSNSGWVTTRRRETYVIKFLRLTLLQSDSHFQAIEYKTILL